MHFENFGHSGTRFNFVIDPEYFGPDSRCSCASPSCSSSSSYGATSSSSGATSWPTIASSSCAASSAPTPSPTWSTRPRRICATSLRKTQLVETCGVPEPAGPDEDDRGNTADNRGPGGYEHPWSSIIPHTYRTTCLDFGFSNCNSCDQASKDVSCDVIGTVADRRKVGTVADRRKVGTEASIGKARRLVLCDTYARSATSSK